MTMRNVSCILHASIKNKITLLVMNHIYTRYKIKTAEQTAVFILYRFPILVRSFW